MKNNKIIELKLRILIIVLIIFTLISCAVVPRDSEELLNKANREFSNQDYKAALVLYEQFLEYYSSKNKEEVLKRIADCYFKIDKPNTAYSYLERIKNYDIQVRNILGGYYAQKIIEEKNESKLSFLEFVEEVASKNNIDIGLIMAIMKVESNFELNKIYENSFGLMQLSNQDSIYTVNNISSLLSPPENIWIGAKKLSTLLNKFMHGKKSSSLEKAIIAYGFGEIAIQDTVSDYHLPYLTKVSNFYEHYRYNYENQKMAENIFHTANPKQEWFSKSNYYYEQHNAFISHILNFDVEKTDVIKDDYLKAILFNNLAIMAESLNRNDLASELYEKAYNYDLQNEDIIWNYAVFLHNNSHIGKSYLLLDRLSTSTEYAENSLFLKIEIHLAKGNYKYALKLLSGISEKSDERHRLKAICNIFSKNYNQAEESFEKAYKLNPSNLNASNLSVIYYKNYVDSLAQIDYIPANNINKSEIFIWPLNSFVVSSRFGWRPGPFSSKWEKRIEKSDYHKGIDLVADELSPIYSIFEGKVIVSEFQKSGGESIVIEHSNGFYSVYYHLNDRYVEKGDYISKGQRIGTLGNTGRSTGAHLHFGLYNKNWKELNPNYFLPEY